MSSVESNSIKGGAKPKSFISRQGEIVSDIVAYLGADNVSKGVPMVKFITDIRSSKISADAKKKPAIDQLDDVLKYIKSQKKDAIIKEYKKIADEYAASRKAKKSEPKKTATKPAKK